MADITLRSPGGTNDISFGATTTSVTVTSYFIGTFGVPDAEVVDPPTAVGPGGVGAGCPAVLVATRLWLALDVEIGGVEYHFGTIAGEVDGVVYRSGLTPLDLSRLVDLFDEKAVTITSSEDWPRIFADGGFVVDGGRAKLYLVVEEDGVTRRTLWADARVDSLRWGIRGQPIEFILRPTMSVSSIPPEQWRIDRITRPVQEADDPNLYALVNATSYEFYEDSAGLFYPLIIGYPGHIDNGDPYPCVPIPVVQFATYTITVNDASDAPADPPSHPAVVSEVYILVVAGGEIEAESFWMIDKGTYRMSFVEQLGGAGLMAIQIPDYTASQSIDGGTLGPDLLGQQCTWIPAGGNNEYQFIGGEPERYAGFQRAAGAGGGLKHNGVVVRGASDVFAWLVDKHTSLKLDRGRHAAHAPQLNRYLFDTFVNDPVDAFEWFTANMLEYVPATIARGPDGVYLAHLPLRATRVDVVLTLEQGRNAEFVSMTTSSTEQVVNHLTYSWGEARDGSSWVFTQYLTREYGLAQRISETYYRDPRMLPHMLCRASFNAYGHKADVLQIGSVWDKSTAHRCAEDLILRRAFPERTLRYVLRPEFWWVEPGMVVMLTDARLHLEARYATVIDVILRVTEVEVVLRMIRSITSPL